MYIHMLSLYISGYGCSWHSRTYMFTYVGMYCTCNIMHSITYADMYVYVCMYLFRQVILLHKCACVNTYVCVYLRTYVLLSRVESPIAQLYSTSTMEHHHFDHSIMILNSEVCTYVPTCTRVSWKGHYS